MVASIFQVNNSIIIKQVAWRIASQPLSYIRRTVFIEEQHVPEALEWELDDQSAIHLLATNNHGNPVGCARMKADGHIGRMAVLMPYRQQGVGRQLLKQLLQIASTAGHHTVRLDAQSHAISFYQQCGFTLCSEEFIDAGIPHRSMELILSSNR